MMQLAKNQTRTRVRQNERVFSFLREKKRDVWFVYFWFYLELVHRCLATSRFAWEYCRCLGVIFHLQCELWKKQRILSVGILVVNQKRWKTYALKIAISRFLTENLVSRRIDGILYP